MKFGKWLIAAYFAFLGSLIVNVQFAVAAEQQPASAAQVSTPPQIPFKRDHTSAEGDLPRVALGLTACLLLLAGAVYVIRRRLGLTMERGRVKRLRVVESHRLNPRSSLYVVEFAGNAHLLAQSEHGINCLVSTPIVTPPSPESPA